MKPEHSKPKEIFAEALRLSIPAERRAYLDQACAGNAALRQEVESLLEAYEQAGSGEHDWGPITKTVSVKNPRLIEVPIFSGCCRVPAFS